MEQPYFLWILSKNRRRIVSKSWTNLPMLFHVHMHYNISRMKWIWKEEWNYLWTSCVEAMKLDWKNDWVKVSLTRRQPHWTFAVNHKIDVHSYTLNTNFWTFKRFIWVAFWFATVHVSLIAVFIQQCSPALFSGLIRITTQILSKRDTWWMVVNLCRYWFKSSFLWLDSFCFDSYYFDSF